MRSFATVLAVAAVGALGLLSHPGDVPPARVVDALVDTELIMAESQIGPASWPSRPAPSTTTTLGTPPTGIGEAITFTATTSTTAQTTSAASLNTAGLDSSGLDAALNPNARERGEYALASYSYDWRRGLPGWEISFHTGREGVLGYTFVQEKRIEIYVRPDMSDALLAHVVAHELGHAVDVTLNSGDDRRRWQEERGIGDSPWWPGNGATDFSTGAGDFAESFASWQVGSDSFRSRVAEPPTASANALMAELATP